MGTQPIEFSITSEQPWIVLTADTTSRPDRRYWVDIDWSKAPIGILDGRDRGHGQIPVPVSVKVPVTKADRLSKCRQRKVASQASPARSRLRRTRQRRRRTVNGVRWEEIPDYGRGDAALGIYPVTAESILPPAAAPRLEYPVYLPRSGTYEVTLVLGPVMDFVPDRGMRIAVSFDDETPQVLDIFADRAAETFLGAGWWNQFTRDNVRFLRSSHELATLGTTHA